MTVWPLNALVSLFNKRAVALAAAALMSIGMAGGKSKPVSDAKLRISMIPTTDPGKALRENQPLLAYWQNQTGQTPELTIPTSYASVVEALWNNMFDIRPWDGFTHVQAD